MMNATMSSQPGPSGQSRIHTHMEALTSTFIALAGSQLPRGLRHCLGSSCTLRKGNGDDGRRSHALDSRPALLVTASGREVLLRALRLHGGETASAALERIKVPLAFVGWYAMSIVYSLLNKEVLTVWKFPCIFSAVQLLVGTMWIGALWTPLPTLGMSKRRFAPLREPPRLSRAQIWQVSTVAVWLALGHVLSTVAPAYGTVAFTNVVKTLEPLFTCVFSAIFLKQVFALPVYLSLVPVVLGVAVASASEVSFSTISLISGLLSNVCFALRAISAKRLMTKPVGENMNAQNLYAVLTVISLIGILPLALLVEGNAIIPGTLKTIEEVGLSKFLRMLLMAGVSHYTVSTPARAARAAACPEPTRQPTRPSRAVRLLPLPKAPWLLLLATLSPRPALVFSARPSPRHRRALCHHPPLTPSTLTIAHHLPSHAPPRGLRSTMNAPSWPSPRSTPSPTLSLTRSSASPLSSSPSSTSKIRSPPPAASALPSPLSG